MSVEMKSSEWDWNVTLGARMIVYDDTLDVCGEEPREE